MEYNRNIVVHEQKFDKGKQMKKISLVDCLHGIGASLLLEAIFLFILVDGVNVQPLLWEFMFLSFFFGSILSVGSYIYEICDRVE